MFDDIIKVFVFGTHSNPDLRFNRSVLHKLLGLKESSFVCSEKSPQILHRNNIQIILLESKLVDVSSSLGFLDTQRYCYKEFFQESVYVPGQMDFPYLHIHIVHRSHVQPHV